MKNIAEEMIHAIQEEIISLCEIRGECDDATNASVESKILELTNQIQNIKMNPEFYLPRFTLWKTGYTYQTALAVVQVAETQKAIKFKILDSAKGYEFYLPKSAVRTDKNSSEILILAKWFNVEGFLAMLFDRFGSVYKR
jgi:hypothetical protein